MIREKYYSAVLQAGLCSDYTAVCPTQLPRAKMQSVTLPLESWLLCRATRASDNSLAAPAVAGLVQRRGKLNVRFVRFQHRARLGWRHSTGRDVHIPPLTLIHSLGLGKSSSCSPSPRSCSCRRHKGNQDFVLRCSLPGHLHPGKVCPKGKRWVWERGGADEAGLSGDSGCWVEEPKVGCRWVYHRWGEGWRLLSCGSKGEKFIPSWLTRASVRGSARAGHC